MSVVLLSELPIGAPFRYDGRNFYKGSRVEFKFGLEHFVSERFLIYEVRNRLLFLDEGFSLYGDTQVENLVYG